MIKAVLFDLDGVLVDAGPWHFAAFNTALGAHGYEGISLERHRSEFDGLPTVMKIAKLVEQGRVRVEDISSIQAIKQKETLRKIEGCKFDPEKFCLIAGMRKMALKVGIVSNAVYDTVHLVCGKLRIDHMIDIYTTNEDGPPKPDPYLYVIAAQRFDVKPDECLAIEDGHYGAKAAIAAGCHLLRVKNPEEVTATAIWNLIQEKEKL